MARTRNSVDRYDGPIGSLCRIGKILAAERDVERHDPSGAFHVVHEPDVYNQALDALELSRLSRELGEIDER